jgi:16S rRNA (uracil1498-N3)-methyltransferase
MRLHRFFSHDPIVSTIESGNQNDTSDLITQKSATAQWKKVFRFGPGDRVVLFDGTGRDFTCEIIEYKSGNGNRDDETILKIIEVCENNVKPRCSVSLFATLVKKDTFEWITEKATELGVSDIVPVIAERSEKKNLNKERLEKIAIEASEQSGRATVPEIHPVIGFADAVVDVVKRKRPAIAFDPSGIKFSEKTFADFGNSDSTGSIAVFIGPEGGWSPGELNAFKKAGIPILSLGPQILRAETAAIAALSRLVF